MCLRTSEQVILIIHLKLREYFISWARLVLYEWHYCAKVRVERLNLHLKKIIA